MKVDIRYLPGRMEESYIFYQNKHFPIRRTDKVANCRTKRNNDFPTLQYGKRGDL
jgi:putative transposase